MIENSPLLFLDLDVIAKILPVEYRRLSLNVDVTGCSGLAPGDSSLLSLEVFLVPLGNLGSWVDDDFPFALLSLDHLRRSEIDRHQTEDEHDLDSDVPPLSSELAVSIGFCVLCLPTDLV